MLVILFFFWQNYLDNLLWFIILSFSSFISHPWYPRIHIQHLANTTIKLGNEGSEKFGISWFDLTSMFRFYLCLKSENREDIWDAFIFFSFCFQVTPIGIQGLLPVLYSGNTLGGMREYMGFGGSNLDWHMQGKFPNPIYFHFGTSTFCGWINWLVKNILFPHIISKCVLIESQKDDFIVL